MALWEKHLPPSGTIYNYSSPPIICNWVSIILMGNLDFVCIKIKECQ